MTLDRVLAFLAHQRPDAEEVISVLVQMATLAHVTGHYQKRNDGIESAAELIRHCGRLQSKALTPPS